jgi:hypothetical protein
MTVNRRGQTTTTILPHVAASLIGGPRRRLQPGRLPFVWRVNRSQPREPDGTARPVKAVFAFPAQRAVA